MKKNQDQSADAADPSTNSGQELRRRAEERLRRQRPAGGGQTTAVETARLVHELQVHQIELEMQNEELQQARARVETVLAQYTELYDCAPAGYMTLDREGAIRQVNVTGARLFGVERSRLVNRRFGLFVAEGDRRTFGDFVQNVFASHAQECCEVTLPQEGAQPLVLQIKGTRSADGQECRAVVLDITARRVADAALRESEERFRKVFEEGPLGMVMASVGEGRFLSANTVFCQMLGYTEEELKRLTFENVTCLEHRAADMEAINRLWQGQIPNYKTEKRYLKKTGETLWGALTVSLIRSDDGKPLYCLATIEDITDRKRDEAARRLQSAALNATAIPIVITDCNGTIQWINPAFTVLTGYSADEAIGKNSRELVKSGVHGGAFYKAMWDTILVGDVWHGELTNRRKDGSLYPEEQTITPVRNDRGEVTHFIAIKRDLTDQRQLEAQFLQAQKMETVGRLAGGIAHDFNNLLTVINGTAELASMDLREDDPLRTNFEEIRRAGDRAAALTRQLLAFSRKQIMKLEVVNLSTRVADLQGMLQRLIGEHIALVVAPVQEVGSVMADPVQIEQVVMNLAVNARDAMPNGGTLIIETRDVALDAAYAATHPSVQPGPHVMLAISDTGVGMDEATRARIFEPFFTTKDPGKGTGLGLSTVYGIVNQSGGSIWVYSELGKGTTFKIYLPRVEAVAPLDQPAPTITSVHGAETILIVEDEEAVQHLAQRILQLAGYTVLAASNGREALAVLERQDGPVHLVLTDMIMPGMSGRDLVAQIEDVSPRMKVIYTSGYTDEAISRDTLFDRATHFIGKPYTAAELTRKVREVLDSSDGRPARG